MIKNVVVTVTTIITIKTIFSDLREPENHLVVIPAAGLPVKSSEFAILPLLWRIDDLNTYDNIY